MFCMSDKTLYILQYWESNSHVERFVAISESVGILKQNAENGWDYPIKWTEENSQFIGNTPYADYYRISALTFDDGIWFDEL